MSGASTNRPLCLSLRRDDGWDIINYDALERVRVFVRPVSVLPEDTFDQEFYSLQGRPDDLCVVHLPFGGDARVFEVVNDLVADAFDLPTRLFLAEYEEGMPYRSGHHVGRCKSADQILDTVCVTHSHMIPRREWLGVKDRQAVARLTTARQVPNERQAA